MTAVILYTVSPLSFVSIVLFSTSVDPKYFFAAVSLRTTVLGSFSAVLVSPFIAGSVNTLRKLNQHWLPGLHQ